VLELLDAEGNPASFDGSTYGDETVLLNFWASHCVPCVKEMPVLVAEDAKDNRRVVLVSVDTDSSQAAAKRIIAQRASGLTNLYMHTGGKGLEEVVDLVRLPIPTTLVLERGVVTEIIRGPLEE